MLRQLHEKYCCGIGAEIGAGQLPFCSKENTTFIDKFVGTDPDASSNADIISDASEMPVGDASFDWVYSSHCLEHCFDTIKTLKEWQRILKTDGILFLVLPHYAKIFDRFRKRTTLAHHIKEYKEKEHDYHAHDKEIKEGWLQLPDLNISEFEEHWRFPMWDFEKRIENGVMHYHVWTQDDIVRLLQYIGMEILYVKEDSVERPGSFIVISKKVE